MADPTPDIRRQLVTDQVVTRLATLDKLTTDTIYRGEVPAHPPTLEDSDRVASYAVLYTFGGTRGTERDLADTAIDLDYGIQIDIAAGFEADCTYLADVVDQQIYRWAPTVAGLVCGPFKPPPGYDPGPVRRNQAVNPPRFWLPLQYRSTITRS